MYKRFTNKVVLITGAGRGIGRATAINFAKEGAKIALISRTEKELNEVCNEIKKSRGECIKVKADVSREIDILNFIRTTKEKFGTIDILVNNAGAHIEKEIIDLDSDEWDYVLDVNLKATFLCSREALKIMVKKNYGKIINIASMMAGRKGLAKIGAYCAAKSAVISLTVSMASEVKEFNININAVKPSRVETEMFKKFHPDYVKPNFMKPEDIAKVVLFLASEDAKAIKGAAIDVHNGQDLS
ncbi:MAG: SDR family oxidoreductase [Actinomycetota bacterium]